MKACTTINDLIVGVVLAGGKSSRMGLPKALLRLPDGRSMLEAVLEALSPICGRLIMAGGQPDWLDLINIQAHCVADSNPGIGPLAGIESALSECKQAKGALIVACDQPLVTTAILGRLIEGEPDRPRAFSKDSRMHPLPGYYPAKLLPSVRRAVRSGDYSLQTLLAAEGVDLISIEFESRSLIQSFNTPEQFSELATFNSDESR